MLTDALNEYVKDPNNPEKNYSLGIEYELIGQTAAAVSFFLRASERTDDDLLAYECLLKIGNCFSLQNKRHYTVRSSYSRAISLLPKRPEAYYLLSRYEEWQTQYYQSYTLAKIAQSVCDFDCPPLRTDVNYIGKYGLIFEQAVSSWWWGNNMESRKLFGTLVNEYWDDMDDTHKTSVEKNITRLGSGPESQAFTYYYKEEYDKLRYKFPGSENIERSYSQVYQDIFILSMLDGKRGGSFLEIGGAGPYLGNNTYILAKDFEWRGHSIEYDQKFIPEYQAARPETPVHCIDALKVNWSKFIKDHYGDIDTIDYLQLDIEPARNTFELLLSIPFDEYKFAVITYEHDYYVDVTKSYREKSRRYLKMCGYELVVSDVSPDGISNFEDWWIHPDLINPEILSIMRDTSNKTKKAKTYILNQ